MIIRLLEENRGVLPTFSFKGRDLHEEEALFVIVSLNIHIHIE
jgi:hypothetical protein